MKKKITALILVAFTFCVVLTACNPVGDNKETGNTSQATMDTSSENLNYTIDADKIYFVETPLKSVTYAGESGLFPYPVYEKNGKVGLIDLDGKIIVEAKYDWASGCVDNNKDWLVFSYESGDDAVMVDESLFIDTHGGHGLASSGYVYDSAKKKAFEITASEGSYDIEKECKEGAYIVEAVNEQDDNGFPYEHLRKYGIFIDGVLVVDTKYEFADAYLNGLGALKDSNGKWGYFDENGKNVIPFSCEAVARTSWYDEEIPFRCYEGYLTACVDGKWGVFDNKGNTVVEFKYAGLSQCKGGKIFVKNGTRWEYTDIKNLLK